MMRRPRTSPLFPSPPLSCSISGGRIDARRSLIVVLHDEAGHSGYGESPPFELPFYSEETLASAREDRKSTRPNSSHSQISYAVFCLQTKNIYIRYTNISFML